MRRRGSSGVGKNVPFRSLGMPTRESPVAVASTRGRVPLRSVVRVAVRSHRSAPMTAVASVSISCCNAHWASSRTRSTPSPAARAASSSDKADSSRAIGVFSFGWFSRNTPRITPMAHPHGDGPQPHHSRGLYLASSVAGCFADFPLTTGVDVVATDLLYTSSSGTGRQRSSPLRLVRYRSSSAALNRPRCWTPLLYCSLTNNMPTADSSQNELVSMGMTVRQLALSTSRMRVEVAGCRRDELA
jgi:hypothetical protein